MNLEGIGLWYDEETKYLVDTSPGNFETLSRDGNGWVVRTGLPNQKHPDDADTAVDNYLKCIEPRPLPGEVWEITTKDGITSRAVVERVYYGGGEYVSQFLGIYGRYTHVTSKRLLITAEGEYVG